MSRRPLQRNVNESTARKKVRLLLSSEMIAVFVIYRIRTLIFVSRVEEYVFAFALFAVLVSDPFATIFRFTGLTFLRGLPLYWRVLLPKNIDGTAVGFKLFLTACK